MAPSRARWWWLALVAVPVLFVLVSWLRAEPAAAPPGPTAPPVDLAPPPVVAAPRIPPPLEPSSPRSTPVPAPDAGALVELEIEVVMDGRRAPGHPVDLDCRGTRVHRPADVMGFARFELPPGECELHGGPSPVVLRLESAPVRHRLDVARAFELIVRVVDQRGERVPEAEVLIDGQRHLSDWNGVVSLRTWTTPIAVWGNKGTIVSAYRLVTPPAEVTLVLEEAGVLEFVVREPITHGWLRVERGQEPLGVYDVEREAGGRLVVSPSTGSPGRLPAQRVLRLPAGVHHHTFRARDAQGRLLGTVTDVAVAAGERRTVALKLSPLPPITGVVGLSGTPLPGISLVLGAGTTVVATTTSDGEGRFSFDVTGAPPGDPLLEVAVLEPWRVASRAFVRLGDAPLTLDLVPLAP